MIESIKLASADRAVHKRGRPAAASGGTAREGYETPIDALLGKDYAAARRKLIDPAKARPIASHADRFTPELLEGDGSVSVAAGDPLAWYKAQGSTTHFDVVDKDGNVFGCTHSLGNGFGSGIVVPGTGIALNNFMWWADVDPASPACLKPGLPASFTDISCVSPFMVWDGDTGCDLAAGPRYALGTPGSYGIPQTTTQLLCNVLDFGLDIQEAIEMPRLRMPEMHPGRPGYAESHASFGKTVDIEARFPEATIADLAAKGHDVVVQPAWTALVGGMAGVSRDPSTGVLTGGADPRRDGYAIGW